jgi:hypothetical protein
MLRRLCSCNAHSLQNAPSVQSALTISRFRVPVWPARLFAPERIPLNLVPERIMSEVERGEAVAALNEVSLLELQTKPGEPALVKVPRLVQQVMRGRLMERDKREHRRKTEGHFATFAAEATCRSASNPHPPKARAGAKPCGATLRCAPPALAPRRHNLRGGQLFSADWSAPLRVDRY